MSFQETHVTDTAEATSWFSSSVFLTVTAPVTAFSRGQVLLYRPGFSFVNSWVGFEGRFLIAEFSRRDSVFFTSCLDFADPSVSPRRCGDFNAVFDIAKDRRGSDPAVIIRESFVSLELLFRAFCVLDVWRHLHPDLRAFFLHLAETRWLLVLLHRPYWLPVYLASSCVFLFYCSMSFL